MKRRYTYISTTNPEESEREKKNFAESLRITAECLTLLENDGTLPLKKPGNIALYGDGARNTIRGGTGSGMTISRYTVNIEQGLEAAGYTVTTGNWLDRQDARREKEHAAFLEKMQGEAGGGFALMLMMPTTAMSSEPVTEDDIAASNTDTAIFVLSRNAGEGDDRKYAPGDFLLTEDEKANISLLASRYSKFILIINSCGVVATEFIKSVEGINAILMVGQPGAAGGSAVADVLTGKVNPSGRLADTWGLKYTDYASSKNFGLQEGNMDDVYYEEGIYVGYRYFDTFNVTPGYPFGYGLSYTDFETEVTGIKADTETVSVSVKVRNKGSVYAGKEVVQIYVSAPAGSIEKPYQELKGFGKTNLIQPGASEEMTITFKTPSLASYSEKKAAWVLEKGDYYIRVGQHSRNTKVAGKLVLDADVVTEQLENKFKDVNPVTEISAKGVQPYSYDGEEAEKASAPAYPLTAADFETRKVSYPVPQILEDRNPGVVITAQDVLSGKYTLDELVAQLTVEEMAAFTTGNCTSLQAFFQITQDMRVPGSAAQSTDICLESRGIEEWVCSDGPAGLHVDPEFVVYKDGTTQSGSFDEDPAKAKGRPFDHSRDAEIEEHHYMHCTAFPVSSTIAMSWDLDNLRRVGIMYGAEMKEIWMQTCLKPSMNIHRDPLGGRNFEYFSEDPLLAGTYAAADILALQTYPGITNTVKHFAVNSNERNRMHSCAHVSERALREIYLKGFEIAIRTSQPGCIMSSYNLINGIHAANNRDLLTDVCRDEWGYDGMIMTDWFMTDSTVDVFSAVDREKELKYGNTIPHECTYAGNDIVMPGADTDRSDIIEWVKSGKVSLADLQRCTKHVIQLILRTDVYENSKSWYEYVNVESPAVQTVKE